MIDVLAALPMFPLGTVLFPHGPLPLHIFEPRYRALAQRCAGGTELFGVVLIERGQEVGGGDARFDVGTAARVVEAAELPDGRWYLVAVGVQRVRVDRWLADDPYPLADVHGLVETPLPDSADDLFRRSERAVRRALAYTAELGDPAAPATVALSEDRSTAALQLATIAPLGPLDKQALLTEDDPSARLDRLLDEVEALNRVLEHRLGGSE